VRERAVPQTYCCDQTEVGKAETAAEYRRVRSTVCCLGSEQPPPQPAAHTALLPVQLLGPHSAAEQSAVSENEYVGKGEKEYFKKSATGFQM